MYYKYSNQYKSVVFTPLLSKLRQKLGQLIKQKSQSIRIIFHNSGLIKGGVYILNRKCGKPSCKCATTSYRHPSYYLYRSEQGKNNIIYLKQDEISQIQKLTQNYIKFRQARASLIKNEAEIMKIINEIEKERTIPFNREGINAHIQPRSGRRPKKKKK